MKFSLSLFSSRSTPGFSKLLISSLLAAVFMVACGDSDSADSVDLQGVAVTPSSPQAPAPVDDVATASLRILFLGDSITAGYGIDQADAFPARVETRLSEAGYSVTGIDAGVSGDTSTGGLNRLDWMLQNRVDILVLELGGNDGLRGIDLSLTRSNLGAIIEQTRESWPGVEVVLVGMRVPPNLGRDYTEEFASMYPEIAEACQTHFVPFIAESFEEVMDYVQNDGIHPTEEGHAIIAEKVGNVVEPLVKRMQAD